MRIGVDSDRHTEALGVFAQPPIQIQSIRAGVEFNRFEAAFLVVFGHVFEHGE